jgi:hypothetical protein
MRANPRQALAVALVGLLAASCASGRSTDAADADPTFHKVTHDLLAYTEPVATAADLQPPLAEGQPWRVVGSMLDPSSGRSRAAVWSATEPPQWERFDVESPDGKDEAMEAVVPFPAGQSERFLAVGRVGQGERGDAAVWQSEGEAWTRLTPPEMGGRHEQWAFAVAAGQRGVLAAGGETIWGEIRPRLWFSADGRSWTSVDGGPGGPLDTTGEESVQDITAVGEGFAAVGMRDLDGDQDAMVWLSPNGTDWEEVEVPSMAGGGRQNAQSVAMVGGTLVAGGYRVDDSGQGMPVVWTSTDGRTWSDPIGLELYDDPRRTGSDLTVKALTAMNDTELLAAGGDTWRPHLWVSRDAGATWERLANPAFGGAETFKDGIRLADIAADPARAVVALGAEPTVLALDRERWVDATGDSFPVGGQRPGATSVYLDDEGSVVVGGFNVMPAADEERKAYTGRVWIRGGGGIRVVEPTEEQPDLEAGRIKDVARFAGGYVAVGIEDFAHANRRMVGNSQPDGLIWTSEDATAWTRQATEPAQVSEEELALLAGTFDDLGAAAGAAAEVENVAPLGNGYIAVGSAYREVEGGGYDVDPVVVVSPDGAGLNGEDAGLYGGGTQRFRDVCVAEDGTAIAVGISGGDGSYDVKVQRRSADGAWEAGSAEDGSFEGAGSQEAFACATGPDGYLVVGSDDSRGNVDARVWTSTDGLAWKQLPSGLLGGTGDQVTRAAAAAPRGGWLVGGADNASGDNDAALWRVLPSGQILRRDYGEPSLGGSGDQSVSALAVTEDRTVIVGEDRSGVGVWETSRLDR